MSCGFIPDEALDGDIIISVIDLHVVSVNIDSLFSIIENRCRCGIPRITSHVVRWKNKTDVSYFDRPHAAAILNNFFKIPWCGSPEQ